MSESPSPLLEETHGRVRVLRMNRPEKRNALSGDLVRAIVEAVEEAAADDAIRVVGLTGSGAAFSAGADLGAPADRTEREAMAERVVRLVRGLRVDCEKPVVAGIGGIAIGAGLSLALCTDIRIAGAKARFHPGYARVGTSPDCGLTWTLPEAIGRERALRFLLEPRMHDAGEALALGLVGEVVPDEGLDEAFLATCEKLAEVAPLAAQQTKRLVTRVGLLDDLEQHLKDELRLTGRALRSDEGRAAVRAIFRKRTPEPTKG